MSCGCYEIRLQGEQFCQNCMPDEFSWLVSVDSKPDPFLMDRNHAYITPDNTVFVLDHTRSKAVPISGGGGGVDLSPYALKTELESKVKDLLVEIQGVNSKIKTYKAGRYIEVTPDNTINNTYDDTALSERISALELQDAPVYSAGQGITIRPDKTIDADVTLDKVNEVVTRAVADTEINLNSANLAVEDNNLVWKGTLNTGRQITSSVPLSSLGVNQSAIDELIRRITAVENKADKEITYTAGVGISVTDDGVISLVDTEDNDDQTLTFNNTTRSLSISGGNKVTIPDKDTTYIGDKNVIIASGNKIRAKEFVEYSSSMHYLRSPLLQSGGAVIKQGLEGNSIQFIDHKDGHRYIKVGVYYMKVTDMASAFGWSQPIVEEFIRNVNTVLSADDDPTTPYTAVNLRGNTRFTYEDRADVYVNTTMFPEYDVYIHRLNNNDYEFKYELVGKVAGLDTSYITGYIKDITNKAMYPSSISFSLNGANKTITSDKLYNAVSSMRGVVKRFNTHYIYVDPAYTMFSLP